MFMYKFKVSKKKINSTFTNYYLYELLSCKVSNQITFRSKNEKCNILVEGFRPFKRNITYVINFNNLNVSKTMRINSQNGSWSVYVDPCLIPSLNLIINKPNLHNATNGTITIKV